MRVTSPDLQCNIINLIGLFEDIASFVIVGFRQIKLQKKPLEGESLTYKENEF